MLSAEDWEELIDWLEAVGDVEIGREALNQLKESDGSRPRACWLE